MSGFVPLNAVYTDSVRRTRLTVLVLLLILALAGGSHRPVSFTGVSTPRDTRNRSITHTQLAKLSFDQNNIVGRSHS